MKLLFGLLLASTLLCAQVPYTATQGNTTIYVRDWSSALPFLGAYFPPQAEVKGIMLTACTTDPAARMASVIKYRAADGSVATRSDDLGKPADAGWARCATVVIQVERVNIASISIQVIASEQEFSTITQ